MKAHDKHLSKSGPWQLLSTLLLPTLIAALLFVGLRITLARSQAPVATLCVTPGGSGGCFGAISDAMAAAGAGDVIQVAGGDYEENVVIEKDVTLEGGWNETFTERDPAIYVSTIRPEIPEQSVVGIVNADPILDGFTITGGRAANGGNHGGGLRLTDSNALIRNNRIISNTAYLFGGGIWVQRGAPILESNHVEDNFSTDPAGDSSGGGVQLENSQTILVSNVISDNVAEELGGGVDISGGAVSMVDNHIAGNRLNGVGNGGGVAIHSTTTVTVVRDLVTGNAADGGGGIFNNGGTLFISGATIMGNRSGVNVPSPGGGLYTIGGSVTIHSSEIGDNRAANGGGIRAVSSEVTVQDSLISGNFAVFRGGGIGNSSSVILINTIISGNDAGDGGGINNGSNGTLFLRNTRLTNNSAEDEGGGIHSSGLVTAIDSTLRGNDAGADGGGLFNYADQATLTNVTISGNSAEGVGGGIYNDWEVALTNTTISDNSAMQGGGLYNDSTLAIASLVNSTVTDNTADDGGGIYNMIPTTLTNSIVAANDDENCGGNDVNTNGYNLEDADTCGFDPNMNDQVNADPLLGPLQDNGGPTLTHAIAADSPAVDAANNDDCPDTDQRGRPRVDGDFDGDITCDIGTYETLLSFTVNSTADKVDEDQGDGICDTGDVVSGEPECTLRAAILEANALGGAEVIEVPAATYRLTIENPEPVAHAPAIDEGATGDLDIRASMDIAGAGADSTTIDANGIDRVFDIVPADMTRSQLGSTVTISGMTIENGSSDEGGGISNSGVLTLRESISRNNRADIFGGGIFNNDNGILTVIRSTITGNFGDDSGGIHTNGDSQTTVISSTISLNTTDGSGGGINDNGILVIVDSILQGNVAATNGGALNHNAGDATLFNVTISGNSAGDFGGGLRNHLDTAATFANVTIADNQADDGGGGIYNEGEAALVNTLFANNAGDNCQALTALSSEGHNLADDASCGFDANQGDVITPDARLGSLQDNGGPTLTHALLAGSPAIDAGHVAICPQTDQRSIARPIDGDGDGEARCDIGAFEKEPGQDPDPDPDPDPETYSRFLPLIVH